MNVASILTILNIILAALKLIPQTAPYATEISAIESTVLAAVSKAQADLAATAGVVDPLKLNPIDPVP